LGRWLIGLAWSILLVAATALFAAGGRWRELSDTTAGVKETRTEVATVKERVTKVETEISHLCESNREIKASLSAMDERQRQEYQSLLRAIREKK
jgi:septal ring factor EnvC (AmiA/AmiB activator)